MDVILLDNIEKVGAKHEVVKVKDGYGRNYLLPRGLAIVANKSNMARLEGLKKQADKKEAVVIAQITEMVKLLDGKTLSIKAKAGESGRLFGSVSAHHIVQALEALGVTADRRQVEMPDEVKDLGSYTATVKFHSQVVREVPFEVVAEEN